jgi:hypothetical protein
MLPTATAADNGGVAEGAMQYDRRGLAVTSESAAAVQHLDAAIRACLAHRSEMPTDLDLALAADGDLVLGHTLLGFARLLLARRELLPDAAAALRHLCLVGAGRRQAGRAMHEAMRRAGDGLGTQAARFAALGEPMARAFLAVTAGPRGQVIAPPGGARMERAVG